MWITFYLYPQRYNPCVLDYKMALLYRAGYSAAKNPMKYATFQNLYKKMSIKVATIDEEEVLVVEKVI